MERSDDWMELVDKELIVVWVGFYEGCRCCANGRWVVYAREKWKNSIEIIFDPYYEKRGFDPDEKKTCIKRMFEFLNEYKNDPPLVWIEEEL